ncbi:MAG: hypothetical protein ABIB71_00705 [Candidatus Woesearchaeota archaeon]
MASLIDMGILNYFAPVFVFLLIYGIIFALLTKVKLFGDNKGTNALIAFAIAFLFILTPELLQMVQIITPWFTILMVFVLLLALLFLFVGVKESEVAGAFKDKGVVWVLIIIGLAIMMYAMTQVYGVQINQIYAGDDATADDASGLNQDIGRLVFHPRVLGALLLLFIAAQAVRMIAGKYQ